MGELSATYVAMSSTPSRSPVTGGHICGRLRGVGNFVEIDDFERRAVACVLALAEERGWSRRELAERSGLTRSRTQYVLAGERSCSMTAFERMCSALGVLPSTVVGEVEQAREREAMSHDDGTEPTSSHRDTLPDRPGDGLEAERDRIAALIAAGVDPDELGLAASRGHGTAEAVAESTGWREDLGEESQVGPEEE